MDLCTKLSDKVLDLENIKNAQALEIQKLKIRVKKLESKKKSRTPRLKRRLFRVRIESSANKSLGDLEDAPKQGRNETDQDKGISWFQEDSETHGRYGHDVGVTTTSTPVTTAGVYVGTTEPSTPPTTTTTTLIEDEDLNIASGKSRLLEKEGAGTLVFQPHYTMNSCGALCTYSLYDKQVNGAGAWANGMVHQAIFSLHSLNRNRAKD
ncbi:hypothetical protein Tco_1357560, partial [Tanacetum coccineum]